SGSSVGAAADLSGSSPQARLSPVGLVAGTHALFTFPNRVIFGVGTRASLAAELNRLRMARLNDGRFRVTTEAKLRPLARFGCSMVWRLISAFRANTVE